MLTHEVSHRTDDEANRTLNDYAVEKVGLEGLFRDRVPLGIQYSLGSTKGDIRLST